MSLAFVWTEKKVNVTYFKNGTRIYAGIKCFGIVLFLNGVITYSIRFISNINIDIQGQDERRQLCLIISYLCVPPTLSN